MSLSLSLSIKNKLAVAQAKELLAQREIDTKKYIDDNDFKNVQPKIGYLDEKNYPIFGTYNISFSGADNVPSWSISDAAGREIVYVRASDGQASSSMKIYRSYRFNSNEEYMFENTDIRPKYLEANKYIDSILGLGCEWIVYHCSDGNFHLVFTKGQSYEYWTDWKDITTIMTGDIQTVIYFQNTKTIGIFARNGLSRELRLFSYDTLAAIKTVTLFDGTIGNGIVKPADRTGTANHFPEAFVYNKNTQQLFMYANYQVSEAKNYHYFTIANIWAVDDNFLATGIGKFIPKWTGDFAQVQTGDACDVSQFSAIKGCYDDYQQVIRYVRKFWDSSQQTVYKTDARQTKTNCQATEAMLSLNDYWTTDASPWAKGMYPTTVIMDGNLYFNGRQSQKYGDKTISSEYYKEYDNNGYLKMVPGRWWLSQGVEDGTFQFEGVKVLQCQVINGNGVWQVVTNWGGNVNSVGYKETTRDGKLFENARVLTDHIMTLPHIPNGYIGVSCYCAYNAATKKVLGIVAKLGSDGYPYLLFLEYDIVTTQFTEHDIMPQQIKNEEKTFKSRHDGNFDGGGIASYSNVLIDGEGNTHFVIRFEMLGWADTFCLIVAPDYTVTIGGDLGAYYASKTMGFDPVFGYYKTTQGLGYNGSVFYHTKDITGKNVDKLLNDFKINSGLYCTKIGLKSATGLVAYSQKIPVLVNGKCRPILSSEVALFQNCDNYIFAMGKDDKFSLEARTGSSYKTGENHFNTILIAKITTDSSDPIVTEYYNII